MSQPKMLLLGKRTVPTFNLIYPIFGVWR